MKIHGIKTTSNLISTTSVVQVLSAGSIQTFELMQQRLTIVLSQFPTLDTSINYNHL